MTKRPDSLGRPRYQMQCLACRQQVGEFVAKSEVEADYALAGLPLFDEHLKQKAWDNLRLWDTAQTEFELNQMRPVYEIYLKSPDWKSKRDLVLKRAHGLCEGCGRQAATQVHHFHYDNLGDELLWELAAVCDACHERSHPWKDDDTPNKEARRQRLHRQIEKSPLFRAWALEFGALSLESLEAKAFEQETEHDRIKP